jgi:hypothetical protein
MTGDIFLLNYGRNLFKCCFAKTHGQHFHKISDAGFGGQNYLRSLKTENKMEILADLIKIVLPAALVLLGIYISIEALLRRQMEKTVLELRSRNTETILPVRLQAYERMALFLERISPQNLIIRVNQPNMTSGELHAVLIREIREEYGHNLSQQIYMGQAVWTLIRNAMEDMVSVANTCAQETDPQSPSIELARRIFEHMMKLGNDPIQNAMSDLKNEIAILF